MKNFVLFAVAILGLIVLGCSDGSFFGQSDSSQADSEKSEDEGATTDAADGAEPDNDGGETDATPDDPVVDTDTDAVQPPTEGSLESCIENERQLAGVSFKLDEVKGILVLTGDTGDNFIRITSMVNPGHAKVDDNSENPMIFKCLNRIEFHGDFGEDRFFIHYEIGSFRAITNEKFSILFDGGGSLDTLQIVHGVNMDDSKPGELVDPDGKVTRLDAVNLAN